MKTFVVTLALIALIDKNVNGMSTSCLNVEPNDFCSQEIQPNHCANTAELACSTDANCCKDGCGKFRCIPKASKPSLHPDTFRSNNPIGCPAFDIRQKCTRDIQLNHCANSAEHICPAGSVCCRNYCGTHHCYVSNAPQLDDYVIVKSVVNLAGCPKLPIPCEVFCPFEIQEKHCANSGFYGCRPHQICCPDICGKYYCRNKIEEVKASEELSEVIVRL